MSAKKSQLVMIAAHYQSRRDPKKTFTFKTDQLDVKDLQELDALAKTLQANVVRYDRGTKQNETEAQQAEYYMSQMDQMLDDTYVDDETPYSMSFEDGLLMQNNINWLEQRGYLKPDEHNGMQFVYRRVV